MHTADFTKVRLIATDLDGTLLTGAKQITPRTMAALTVLRQRGMMLAVVTGRSLGTARDILTTLQPDAAVLSYGGHILLGHQTIFRRFMSPKVVNQVLQAADAAEYLRVLTEDGQFFAEKPQPFSLPLDRKQPVTRRVDHVCAWNLPAKTAAEIAKRTRCTLTQAIGDAWCNFGPLGCDKASGTRRLMRTLGLVPGEAIAFGNEDCDVGMFTACGIGVAMGNSDDATLRGADYVTDTNEADGVAAFLATHLL